MCSVGCVDRNWLGSLVVVRCCAFIGVVRIVVEALSCGPSPQLWWIDCISGASFFYYFLI